MDVSEVYHLKHIEKLIRQTITRAELPKEVEVLSTPKNEFQDQMREIDRQKRMEDPEFKGAFHEKKRSFRPVSSKKPARQGKPKPGK